MLAISTSEEKVMRSRAIDAGFDGFCPKSNLPTLGETLREYLTNPVRRDVHD